MGERTNKGRTPEPPEEVRQIVEVYKARRRLDPRKRCDVVTVTSVADALGDHCEKLAVEQCSDCGTRT
jgi:hypothetical protein